jgi:cellulose synthase/poly-beta-1,6-N-acetylglucosamine synthase-like glycosyltransferase
VRQKDHPDRHGLRAEKQRPAATPVTSDLGQLLTLGAYYAVLFLLALYGAHRAWMVHLYYRHRSETPRPAGRLTELPRVTVQLPIYNEVYVVERLVSAVAALDYPRSLLQIQILDDSTDETRDLARAAAAKLASRGFDVDYRPRIHRRGYKAGALQDGLAFAAGEFLLILDADFVPRPGLLRETLPHFADPGVGMVQARWDHLNREFSLLTRIQAILLDGHFVIEHTARHRSGRFFNFNGTAGVWRRACIEAAGGWSADTLTEDLDLSYRAQLRGWRFVYLKDCSTPGEVPVDIRGFRSQQHRWTKGSIQAARKLLPEILRSRLPWKVKTEALVHLAGNSSYLLVVALSLLLVPAVVIRDRIGWQRLALLDFPLFFGATLAFLAFYVASQRELGRGWTVTLRDLPGVSALGIGLSVSNARAVLEGLFHGRGRDEFVRTPKYAIDGRRGEWRHKKYQSPGRGPILLEVVLAAYYLAGLVFAARLGYWAAVPFLFVFFHGFAYTAALSLRSPLLATPR